MNRLSKYCAGEPGMFLPGRAQSDGCHCVKPRRKLGKRSAGDLLDAARNRWN